MDCGAHKYVKDLDGVWCAASFIGTHTTSDGEHLHMIALPATADHPRGREVEITPAGPGRGTAWPRSGTKIARSRRYRI